MTRLYLAGPAALNIRAGRLEAAGFEVVKPPPEPDTAPEWNQWARYALALMLTADGVAITAASGGLRGVGVACRLAHELAMPVLTVPGWLTKAGQDHYMQKLRGNPHD
jgi:hypothetical protein